MLGTQLQFLLSDNNLLPENTLIAYLIMEKLSWDSLLRLQAPLPTAAMAAYSAVW